MISPADEKPARESGPNQSIFERTRAFFEPGGVLDQACSNEEFPYEPRPQQQEMAAAVASCLEQERHLAVEAGTGVGKSFAYLVPAILSAVEKQQHVVVSTYTISLQEQLIQKDIPFLREHMGLDFKAVLVKGRSNYLCMRRLERARRLGGDLFKKDQEKELARIAKWAERTTEGSLQSMDEQPSNYVWSLVCAEQANCLKRRCKHYGRCFFMKARERIRDAHVLVVNHHLFFSELALRLSGAGFLPSYSVAVLDEAHQVEDVASEHFGIRLSHYAFQHLMRRLYVPESNKGILAVLKKGKAADLVRRLWEEVDNLYADVREWAHLRGSDSQRTVDRPLAIETEIPERLSQITVEIRDILDAVEDPDLKAELGAISMHCSEMRDALKAFLSQSMEDHVYWVEKEGRSEQTVLHSAPIEVAPILEKALFETVPCVIMTSATLAVADDLNFFKSRVGAVACDTLKTGSPFDYGRQMRILISGGMPDPNDTEHFLPAVARAVAQFAGRSRGRAFVLFTSAKLMNGVWDLVGSELVDEGMTVYMQGTGLPRHVMLERFKADPAPVLFGLSSFWMGVDVRGEVLSNVIITRLPFAVPDQALVKARMDRIKEKGGNPFKEYSLPDAILKFRQGVGRLIRTANDEGIIVILDNRIVKKWYGKLFLASIPECPIEVLES